MIVLLAAAAAAAAPAAFDLAQSDPHSIAREQAAPPSPVMPRGLDLRAVAIDVPELELALLDAAQGPVLRIGALGGRHGAAPKLAHVAVGWRF